ncbi:sugar nucleotide-binding protein [Streptomyces sp. NPDC006684]|uniref:SDR family oxidoreductase n=1 Tax=Streptomyces sp. NPDC006684 TaxID=3154477 RepID=UPI00345244FF
MRILVVGGSGFVGSVLVRHAVAEGHETHATYRSGRPPTAPGVVAHALDLRDGAAIGRLIDATAPHVVVNTSSGGADWSVTAEGAGRLAQAVTRHGARLVHVSSDAVFSGALPAYEECHAPDPVTPYGAAKAAAETAVRLVAPGAVVARTSLVIGDAGHPSEHERLVHALVAGRPGALWTDDVRCPVHVADLAAALCELAVGEAAGVVHLGGAQALSRYELGTRLAVRDGLDAGALRSGTRPSGPSVIRLVAGPQTRRAVRTRLRGADEFLSSGHAHAAGSGNSRHRQE